MERAVDTFTYLYEIKGGFEKETYEDEPYLIPYVCEGSDAAVIVVPGGGFGYKSMDGTTGEGKDIALILNENGISAFVLHYRSNNIYNGSKKLLPNNPIDAETPLNHIGSEAFCYFCSGGQIFGRISRKC